MVMGLAMSRACILIRAALQTTVFAKETRRLFEEVTDRGSIGSQCRHVYRLQSNAPALQRMLRIRLPEWRPAGGLQHSDAATRKPHFPNKPGSFYR